MSEEIKDLTVVAEEEKAVETAEATATVSKSKAKREARAKEAKAEKAKKGTDNLVIIIVGIIIGLIVIAVIGCGIYSSVKSAGKDSLVTSTDSSSTTADGTTATDAAAATASLPFSKGLTAEGYIDGLDVSKVTVPEIDSVVIPADEVAYTEEDVEAELQTLLSYFKEFSTDAALEVKDGDTIKLDYVGSVDGVEFEGGNTNGQGASLTIGSHTYIDTFEEQLIGAHPGDHVTVNVTFPENYGEEGTDKADLNGKAAVFECTVNSIQVTPELTDEFVTANIEQYYGTKTVDELRTYVEEAGIKNNKYSYIVAKFDELVSTEYVNDEYVDALKEFTKAYDKYSYDYMNSYYEAYLGSGLYESFNDYTGLSDQEYDEKVADEALKTAKLYASYEAYFKAKGLTVTDEMYNSIVESAASSGGVDFFGEEYLHQQAIIQSVNEYLIENIEVK